MSMTCKLPEKHEKIVVDDEFINETQAILKDLRDLNASAKQIGYMEKLLDSAMQSIESDHTGKEMLFSALKTSVDNCLVVSTKKK
jgi:hypothetical protein